jgi:hypothetical protein
MALSEQTTLAEIILGVSGKLAVILSSSLTSVGALWGIYKISSLGVKVLKNVPHWFEMKNYDDRNEKQYLTSENIFKTLTVYGKITIMIFIGILIRILGTQMTAPETISKFNTLIYRK